MTEAPPTDHAATLLTPDFIAKLGRLQLVSRRLFAGRFKGERRTRHRGTSVEFADYRDYAAGDEPRFVDWNAAARLDRLFLKLFVEEEDLFVYFLLDTSRSMDFGEPTKLDYARRVAAALAYLALLGHDRAAVSAFSSGPGPALPPRRGRKSAMELFGFLARLRPGGATSLDDAAHRFTAANRRRGLAIVISDFLDRGGHETALRRLLHAKFEVQVIHILTPGELDPALAGDLRLVDAEDGAEVDVTVSGRMLAGYRAAVADFCGNLKAFCTRHGIGYAAARTDQPFEETVLRTLRTAGLVK